MTFLKVFFVALISFSVIFENVKCLPVVTPEIEDYGSKLQDGDHFDFIVVGSGPGGGVVGSRLSENPDWNVLILDAGGEPPDYLKKANFTAETLTAKEEWRPISEPSEAYCQGTKTKQCQLTAGRVFGGGSTVANMVYQRGNPKNFEQWVEQGNEGWDWDTVLEYYKKSENNIQFGQNSKYHGKGGPITVTQWPVMPEKTFNKDLIKAANAMGVREFDDLYDDTGYDGYGYVQILANGDRKSGVYDGFLKPASKRPNFKLAGYAFVSKVLLDDGPKAIGVEVIINGKKLQVYADKEVIVSAGALSSPKVLLLSGIGPKEDLEKINIKVVKDSSVGKNLQDHLAVWGLFIQLIDNDVEKYSGSLTGVVSTKHEKYPNIQIANLYENDASMNSDSLLEWAKTYNFDDKIIDFFRKMNKLPYDSPMPFIYNPKSRGCIKLKSTDPQDDPSITMNYVSAQEDVDTLTEAINFIETLYTRPELSELNPKFMTVDLPNPKKYKYKSAEYWEYFIRNMGSSMLHYAGTCKMGPANDKTAVVDSRLRVHGVEGLRVVDASIMPNIVSANILMTVIMIGEKAADMIKEDYGYYG